MQKNCRIYLFILFLKKGGGTFRNAGDASKTIAYGEYFGQLPVLEDYPDHDFSGWYIVKPDASSPYDDSSFLQKATERTKAGDNMLNSKNEIIIAAKWDKLEHAADITVTDMDWKPVDKNNNRYEVTYGGRGNDTGLGFTATVLPGTLKDSAKYIKWTSSDPDIISVTAGTEVIYSGNWFDCFTFGTNTGDVVLTVRSEDNPNVSFDIHVTVKGE